MPVINVNNVTLCLCGITSSDFFFFERETLKYFSLSSDNEFMSSDELEIIDPGK